jgi:hypothetical protein
MTILRRTPAGPHRTRTGVRRALAALVVGALGALAAVGLYAEATRAPDQP